MMNESLITTGSIFLSGAFVSLLYPQRQEMSEEELEAKINLALELIHTSKIINAPILVERLNCDSKTAHKILNILVERGYITPLKE